MTPLVRLRFIDWLQRSRDHVAKQAVNYLRRCQVHPKARADDGLRCGACVDDRLSKGQINSPVELSSLGYEIDIGNRHVIPRNDPSLFAYLERVRFDPNNSLIHHQNPPIGKSYDLSSLNAKAVGVES